MLTHKEIPIVRPVTGMWALSKLIGKTAYGPSVTLSYTFSIIAPCFERAAVLNGAQIVCSGYF
jgi:hypothetical protein